MRIMTIIITRILHYAVWQNIRYLSKIYLVLEVYICFHALEPSVKCVSINEINNQKFTKNTNYCRLLQSLYLCKLLEYFTENKKPTGKEAYIYGVAVVLSILLRVLTYQFHYLETFSTGLKVRTSCCSLIYRKMVTSKFATALKHTLPHILNLFSTDLDKFEMIFCYFHRMWSGILKIIVGTLLFLSVSGYQGVVGMGIIVIFALSQC